VRRLTPPLPPERAGRVKRWSGRPPGGGTLRYSTARADAPTAATENIQPRTMMRRWPPRRGDGATCDTRRRRRRRWRQRIERLRTRGCDADALLNFLNLCVEGASPFPIKARGRRRRSRARGGAWHTRIRRSPAET
jgi:hypothetical protein